MLKIFKEIRKRILAKRWFYNMCHTQRFNFLFDDSLWPDWKGDPKEIFSPDKLCELLKNSDSESRKVVMNFIEKVTLDMNLRSMNFTLSYPEYSDKNAEEYAEYQKNEKIESIANGIPALLEESFFFHHGMRNLPDSVKKYVRNKIFIDGGACFGDSSLMFLKYHPEKVIAFDISPINAEIFCQVMKKNNMLDDKVFLILKGLGDKNGSFQFMDGFSGGTSLNLAGDCEAETVTLDSCKEVDGPVGWIKIDLEGYGLPAVKGMVETIKRDRPVLTLAVYHCADELFGIKKLLESLDLNYKIMFRSCRFDEYHELTLIAYPAELE